MKPMSKAKVSSLLLSTVAAAAVALPSATQAAEVGQVCNLNTGASVFAEPARINVRYQLGVAWGFRIKAFADNNTYFGNGNGYGDGYLWRNYIDQSSCHW